MIGGRRCRSQSVTRGPAASGTGESSFPMTEPCSHFSRGTALHPPAPSAEKVEMILDGADHLHIETSDVPANRCGTPLLL